MSEKIKEWIKPHGGAVFIALCFIVVIIMAISMICLQQEQSHFEITEENPSFNLVSEATKIDIGDSVRIVAQTNLTLDWSLNDPLMGNLRKVSNNEVVFTASKNGTVIIYANAPNTNYKEEIEIQVFNPPTVSLEILSSALLEKGQNYRFVITYPKDSVTINEITLKDDLGNVVEGLDITHNLINIDNVGIYSLEVSGTTYLGETIRNATHFAILPKIESMSSKPSSISLVSLAPVDIMAIEIFLNETHGLSVDLQHIAEKGTPVRVSDGNVALLFVRDNGEERVWAIEKLTLGDFYPVENQNGFKKVRLSDNQGTYWTIAVDYSEYTSKITCVVAFPEGKGFSLDGQITGSQSSDSSSGGGGSIPPIVVPSGPSPDISP
ncbi:MAG: hypothetical protein PHX52_01685 [Candidatus Pacebacteria bacterium]|nr:hypothetical protein [Candidatus Paceibacterota bacterium]MDD3919277.1 hypothetical protein [Candidatus Paceibacterota bacterium]